MARDGKVTLTTFEPLQPRDSAVDVCARAVRRAIIGGELTPGSRLPPERTLAEQFGVNRVTVRGALGQLAQRGLLAVRQGSGYVVQDFRHRGGPDLIAGLAELANGEELTTLATDLLFVRRQLARGVLLRLAEQRRVEVAPIAAAVAVFREAAERGADDHELAAADVAVVRALLDATGSAVLRLSMNPIGAVLAELPELRRALYAEPLGNASGWDAVVAWLVANGLEPDAGSALEVVNAFVAELERRDRETIARLRSAAAVR